MTSKPELSSLNYELSKKLYGYQYVENGSKQLKKGIEIELDIKRIKPIYTLPPLLKYYLFLLEWSSFAVRYVFAWYFDTVFLSFLISQSVQIMQLVLTSF